MDAIVTYSNALANLLQCFSIRGSIPKARMGWTSAARVSLSNSYLLLVLIFISNYPIFHGIIFVFLKLWTIQISGHKMPRCLCFKNPYAGLSLCMTLCVSLCNPYAWHFVSPGVPQGKFTWESAKTDVCLIPIFQSLDQGLTNNPCHFSVRSSASTGALTLLCQRSTALSSYRTYVETKWSWSGAI